MSGVFEPPPGGRLGMRRRARGFGSSRAASTVGDSSKKSNSIGSSISVRSRSNTATQNRRKTRVSVPR